jgi:putative MATE family efflux protein
MSQGDSIGEAGVLAVLENSDTTLAIPGRRTQPTAGVWELAWPSMSAFGLQAVVGFVDILFVSQLGTAAVAGVGIGAQVHFIVFSVMAAVTTGTVALVARDTGAGDDKEPSHVLQLSMVLAAALGVAFSLAAPFADAAVALFGTNATVAANAGAYLEILLLGSVPFGVGITLASAMRGAGDVRTPLFVGAIINVINVVGDYAFIFGRFGAPELGAPGSAVASVLAFTIGTALYLAMWHRNLLIIPRRPLLPGLTRKRCQRILHIGLPTALEHIAFNFGLFVFLRVIAGFGTEAVSAYMIGVRILAFSFIPGLGFSTAASTLVGQQLGANDPEAASEAGWRATRGAVLVMSAVGLGIVSFATPIASAFGAIDPTTIELTVTFIYILGAAQPLMAMEFALGGGLRGAGDTRFPLVAISTGLFVFRLGGAALMMWLLPGSVVAVWCCLLGDYAVKAALLYVRFRRGRWKTIAV